MSSLAILAAVGHISTPVSPDEFAAQSRFYRLDPRAKIVSAVVFAVAMSLMTQVWPLLLGFIGSLVVLAVSRLKLRAISRQLRLVALLIIVIALPVYFARGLEAFIAMLLRVSGATLVLLVMVLTTASADLANGLRKLGLPKTLVTLLTLTYRYIFVYGDEATRMSKAREARAVGHGRGFLDRRVLQTISSTAGLIFVKAHGRATRIHRAMRARGYTGEAGFGRRLRMAFLDGYLMFTICSFSVFLLMVNWGFVRWTP